MVESSGNQARFPTITNQLYQLAAGTVTSEQLVRRALDAIEASQSTLNAFRVVLRKQALADAAEADRKRTAGEPTQFIGNPIAAKNHVDVPGGSTPVGSGGLVPKAHHHSA